MKFKNYSGTLIIILVSIFFVAFLHEPKDTLKDALVGHWTFDEDGEIVADKSEFKSHGELKGKPRKANGIVGKGSLELDGMNDYMEIMENGNIPPQFQNMKKGSIAFWFKANKIPTSISISPLFYYGSATGCDNMKDASNEGLVIEIAHGGIKKKNHGVYFTVFNNPCDFPSLCFDTHSNSHFGNTKGAIKEGEWYHYVAIVGDDFNTGYLNGEEINFRHYNFGGASASQFFNDANKHEKMWIGKGFWNHRKETFLNGSIDDLRIYNAPLSGDDVKKLYQMKN